MSTDIIRFPKADAGPFESLFSRGALGLYLLISLPLVLLTLAGWYIFYRWEIGQGEQPENTNDSKRSRLGWASVRRLVYRLTHSMLPT